MIHYDLKTIKALIFDVDGVLSKTIMDLSPEGDPVRTVNVKDGYALQLAVKQGFHICIITGARVESVRHRFEKLGITDIYLPSAIKIKDFQHFLDKYSLDAKDVLYMGDDIPDYQVMQMAGLPCCPQDAAPEIRALSRYVSPYAGGEGCVRDVVEQVLKAQGLWLSDERAFGW